MVTKAEFSAAYDIAKSDRDLSGVDDSVLYGCASREFPPVMCNLETLARMIRWQCQMLNGQWDCEALTELHKMCRTKVTIIGSLCNT